MDDVALRALDDRLSYLRNLEQRKSDVIAVIDGQGKLTDELRSGIEEAPTLQRVEDLYKPFRKKRATRASKARDAGLEPLANLILMQPAQGEDPLAAATGYINAEGGFATAEAALAGARDIVAELVAEDPENTADLRDYTHKTAAIESEAVDADEKTPYEPYYEFSEAARSIPNHRILAINRGEREGKLRVRVRVDGEAAAERCSAGIRVVAGRSRGSSTPPSPTDTSVSWPPHSIASYALTSPCARRRTPSRSLPRTPRACCSSVPSAVPA